MKRLLTIWGLASFTMPMPPPFVKIPAPSHPWFLVITLLVTVGEALPMKTPPPAPKLGLLKLEKPFLMVKPFRTELDPSLVLNVTTESMAPPSMIVVDGPLTLLTVMALPLKLMFSLYVPSKTTTVSPLLAALIAAWIVG